MVSGWISFNKLQYKQRFSLFTLMATLCTMALLAPRIWMNLKRYGQAPDLMLFTELYQVWFHPSIKSKYPCINIYFLSLPPPAAFLSDKVIEKKNQTEFSKRKYVFSSSLKLLETRNYAAATTNAKIHFQLILQNLLTSPSINVWKY